MTSILHRFYRAHTLLPEARAQMRSFVDYLKALYSDTCFNNEAVTLEECRLFGPDRLMWGTDYQEQTSLTVEGGAGHGCYGTALQASRINGRSRSRR